MVQIRVRSSTSLIQINCNCSLPVDVNLRNIDYVPLLSMTSGVAHIALATLALTLIGFAVIADACTLGRFAFTARTIVYANEKLVRGTLCFIPFVGNFLIYTMDQEVARGHH